MEHKNILSFIAKDIQKTCEKLGIYAEFNQTGDKTIESDEFRLQPAIFKSIHVNVDVYAKPSKNEGEDNIIKIDVGLNYRYTHWDGGENGCRIGWMQYEVEQAYWNEDQAFLDNGMFCNVHKVHGLTI